MEYGRTVLYHLHLKFISCGLPENAKLTASHLGLAKINWTDSNHSWVVATGIWNATLKMLTIKLGTIKLGKFLRFQVPFVIFF